jgi:hypothetical protein
MDQIEAQYKGARGEATRACPPPATAQVPGHRGLYGAQLHLSWLIADRKDLREGAAEDNPFWRKVRAEGVTLAGTPVGRLTR